MAQNTNSYKMNRKTQVGQRTFNLKFYIRTDKCLDGTFILVRTWTYHFQPWNLEKLFNNVEKIENKQNSSKPETCHSHKVEPPTTRGHTPMGDSDTDEAQKIQNL